MHCCREDSVALITPEAYGLAQGRGPILMQTCPFMYHPIPIATQMLLSSQRQESEYGRESGLGMRVNSNSSQKEKPPIFSSLNDIRSCSGVRDLRRAFRQHLKSLSRYCGIIVNIIETNLNLGRSDPLRCEANLSASRVYKDGSFLDGDVIANPVENFSLSIVALKTTFRNMTKFDIKIVSDTVCP